MANDITGLQDLPDEILLLVVRNLIEDDFDKTMNAIMQVAYLNKHFHDLIFQDAELWKLIYEKFITTKQQPNSSTIDKTYNGQDILNLYFVYKHQTHRSKATSLDTNISLCLSDEVSKLLDDGADPHHGEFGINNQRYAEAIKKSYPKANIMKYKTPLQNAESHTHDYSDACSSYYDFLSLMSQYSSPNNNIPTSQRWIDDADCRNTMFKYSQNLEEGMEKEKSLHPTKENIYQMVKRPLSSYSKTTIQQRTLSSLADYFSIRTSEEAQYLHPRFARIFRRDSTKENKLKVARACQIILTFFPENTLNSQSIFNVLKMEAKKDDKVLNLKQIHAVMSNGRLNKILTRYNEALTNTLSIRGRPKQ